MSNERDFFNLVPGMKPVDPASLAEYERAMKEEAIPAMIEEVRRREELAHQSRLGLRGIESRIEQLEVSLGTEQTMHNAWRKRAEEAEAELTRYKQLKDENESLRKAVGSRIWECEKCGQQFSEYHNGCPKCEQGKLSVR
jgi:rubrerythrin